MFVDTADCASFHVAKIKSCNGVTAHASITFYVCLNVAIRACIWFVCLRALVVYLRVSVRRESGNSPVVL